MNRIASIILILSLFSFLSSLNQPLTRTQRIEATDSVDGFEYDIYDIAEIDTFIVEFDQQPLLVSKDRQSVYFYQEMFSRFQSDLLAITEPLKARYRDLPDTFTGKQCYKLFFGIEIIAPLAVRDRIEQLSYVKRLHRSLIYQGNITESVPHIGADQVWQQYGATGEGVLVAVLDSGIDYTHPSLGDGFGPDFKVVGGYDFIDEDSDPMDENGHGTHVAGIIAAEDENLRGVAPDASLLAVRVLNASGQGSSITVISGIEYCVDPNDDNDPSDHVDIANLSLGSSSGNPNDAVCTALDNANALGVTFCVSAGNYANFMSIGSPACAAGAIAVGATTLGDELTTFSSEGPNLINYAVKPELCAPGFNITSTYPGGGTRTMSGTSMAAPHVSGVSALIKQIHPDWQPEMICSAMVNNAVDIDCDIMQQGGGRIDAMAAVDPKVLFEPAILNFAPDTTAVVGDNVVNVSFIDTLHVSNVSGESIALNFSAESPIPALGMNFAPQSTILLPGESTEIVVQLEVNNQEMTIDDLDVFTDWITISASNRDWRIPWTITKVTGVQILHYSSSASFYLFNERNSYRKSDAVELSPYLYQLDVIAGDEYVFFSRNTGEVSQFVCVDDLHIDAGSFLLDVSGEHDFNTINVNGYTESGDLIDSYGEHFYYLNIYFPSARRSYSFMNFNIHEFQADYFPPETEFNIGFSHWDAQKNFHVMMFDTFYGIDSDMTIQNDPNGFREANLVMSFFGWDHFQINPMPLVWSSIGGGFMMGMTFPDVYFDKQGIWGSHILMQGDYSGPRGSSLSFYQRWIDDEEFIAGTPPPLRLQNNQIAFSRNGFPSELEPGYPIGETMYVGHYPFLVNVPCYITASGIEVNHTISDGVGSNYFYSESRLPFVLRNQNGSEVFNGMLGTDEVYLPAAGGYELEMNFDDYSFDDIQGNTKVLYHFNTAQQRKCPPMLNRLFFTDEDGVPLGEINPGETTFLRFCLTDGEYSENGYYYDPIDNEDILLALRINGEEEWQEVPFGVVGEIDNVDYFVSGKAFSADISEFVTSDSCLIDLSIQAMDGGGNNLTYTAVPAFGAGDHVTAIGGDNTAEAPIASDRLIGNFPNPFNPETNIRFSLSADRNVTIDIYNIRGQRVTRILDDRLEAGSYQVTWKGTNQVGKQVSSGIYFVRMQTGKVDNTRKILLLK